MSDVMIGTDVRSGESVHVSDTERLQGITIVGKSKSGKSALLERMILRDISAGTAGLLIDPHGTVAQRVAAHTPANRLDYLTIYEPAGESPFGLNLLRCRAPLRRGDEPKAWAINGLIATLKKLYSKSDEFQPRLERYVRLASETLIAAGGAVADIPLLFVDDRFRSTCLQLISDPTVQEELRRRWGSTFERLRDADRVRDIEAVLNRFDDLLDTDAAKRLLGCSNTTLPTEQVLCGETFLIVNLGHVPPNRVNMFGTLILCHFADQLVARGPGEDRSRVHVYMDEYQRFATRLTADLLTEGRKYQLGVTLAHQGRDQLYDEAAASAELQAATFVVMAVARQDADVLAGQFPVEGRPERLETIEIEDGTEPVKTLSGEPLAQVLREAHPDGVVRWIVNEVLRPIKQQIEQLSRAAPGERHLPRTHVQGGTLDRFSQVLLKLDALATGWEELDDLIVYVCEDGEHNAYIDSAEYLQDLIDVAYFFYDPVWAGLSRCESENYRNKSGRTVALSDGFETIVSEYSCELKRRYKNNWTTIEALDEAPRKLAEHFATLEPVVGDLHVKAALLRYFFEKYAPEPEGWYKYSIDNLGERFKKLVPSGAIINLYLYFTLALKGVPEDSRQKYLRVWFEEYLERAEFRTAVAAVEQQAYDAALSNLIAARNKLKYVQKADALFYYHACDALLHRLRDQPMMVVSSQERPRRRQQIISYAAQTEQDARNTFAATMVETPLYLANVKIAKGSAHKVSLMEPMSGEGDASQYDTVLELSERRVQQWEPSKLRKMDTASAVDAADRPRIGRRT